MVKCPGALFGIGFGFGFGALVSEMTFWGQVLVIQDIRVSLPFSSMRCGQGSECCSVLSYEPAAREGQGTTMILSPKP